MALLSTQMSRDAFSYFSQNVSESVVWRRRQDGGFSASRHVCMYVFFFIVFRANNGGWPDKRDDKLICTLPGLFLCHAAQVLVEL